MSEKDEKCWSVFPEAHKHVLTSLVLSTTQTNSADCQRGVKKAENIHIQEDWIREFCQMAKTSHVQIQ